MIKRRIKYYTYVAFIVWASLMSLMILAGAGQIGGM